MYIFIRRVLFAFCALCSFSTNAVLSQDLDAPPPREKRLVEVTRLPDYDVVAASPFTASDRVQISEWVEATRPLFTHDLSFPKFFSIIPLWKEGSTTDFDGDASPPMRILAIRVTAVEFTREIFNKTYPVLLHELGHLVYSDNIPLQFPASMWVGDDKFYVADLHKEAESLQSDPWEKDKYTQQFVQARALNERIWKVVEKARPRIPLISRPYEEFFADEFAVLASGDAELIANHSGDNSRSFVHPTKQDPNDPHELFPHSREFIWNQFQASDRSPDSASQLLAISLKSIAEELSLRSSDNVTLDPDVMDQRLLAAIQQNKALTPIFP